LNQAIRATSTNSSTPPSDWLLSLGKRGLTAGDEFRNIFAVADDDQIIYQWTGASYRQISAFRELELTQLVYALRWSAAKGPNILEGKIC
jgi:hypothetical protein